MTRSRRRYRVVATRSFAAALSRLEASEALARSTSLERLRTTLRIRVLPLLERQPAIGRPFRGWTSLSAEGRQLVDAIRARLGARDVREYVTPEHLVLYLVGERLVHLASVRHQRELTYPLLATPVVPERGRAQGERSKAKSRMRSTARRTKGSR